MAKNSSTTYIALPSPAIDVNDEWGEVYDDESVLAACRAEAETRLGGPAELVEQNAHHAGTERRLGTTWRREWDDEVVAEEAAA
jgi:hypothetical protein